MAFAYVDEFSGHTFLAPNNRPTQLVGLPLATQRVALGASSTQSAAFNASTQLVRITADGACCFLIGADPTALATSSYLPAAGEVWRAVSPGHKIAVINP
jgi:hypothetical protein